MIHFGKAALVAWMLSASAFIKDNSGLAGRPSDKLLDVIADESLARPLFDELADDANVLTTAGLYLEFAFRESSYIMHVKGDGGHSCGSWGHWTTGATEEERNAQCERLRHDWRYAINFAHDDFVLSRTLDAQHPWAAYAGGPSLSDAAKSISDKRNAEILYLVNIVPW